MLVSALSILLFLTFLTLGGFHFYWLFGGQWGLTKVFPTKRVDAPAPKIPKVATLIVALGLVAFGCFYLIKLPLLPIELPHGIVGFAYWLIPGIFILRAIGDFNYVGFFKRIKGTPFAQADKRLFSPLCLGIGLVGIMVEVI